MNYLDTILGSHLAIFEELRRDTQVWKIFSEDLLAFSIDFWTLLCYFFVKTRALNLLLTGILWVLLQYSGGQTKVKSSKCKQSTCLYLKSKSGVTEEYCEVISWINIGVLICSNDHHAIFLVFYFKYEFLLNLLRFSDYNFASSNG